jgi:hypothetical protein
VVADLSNTIHSCSRHGVTSAGLNPEQPVSIIPSYNIFTLLKISFIFPVTEDVLEKCVKGLKLEMRKKRMTVCSRLSKKRYCRV